MKTQIKAGLTLVGKNKEGEMEYIGTDKEWNKAEQVKCEKCGAELADDYCKEDNWYTN